MRKSELKEMIKLALSEDARTDAEQEGYEDGFDDAKDDIEAKLKDMKVSEGDNYHEDGIEEGINGARIEGLLNIDLKNDFLAAGHAVITDFLEDEMMDVGEIVSHLANELERHYDAPTYGEEELEEGEIAEAEEVDVDVEDESIESDIEVDASMPDESETEISIQSLLMKAQEEATKLGDEKLTDQIGNTITYFTRAHVAQVDEVEVTEESTIENLDESTSRFAKLAGIIK